MNDNLNTKVITGKVRMSYVHVWEPVAISEGGEKNTQFLLLYLRVIVKLWNPSKRLSKTH